jgi:hypothetical protein
MDKGPGPEEIRDWVLARYDGTLAVAAWGESSIFYNPAQRLPRGVYFATLKEKDGENDRGSALDRDGVFRLNIGTPRALFEDRFGPPPKRPAKGQIIEGAWDFTQLDRIMPHPVYGWMSWMAVLNPSRVTFEELEPLMDAAYAKAKAAFGKRIRR